MATVKVILLESLKGYGAAGDIMDIPGGFVRNYLIPFRKAQYATPDNIKALEIERATLEKKDLELKQEAQHLVERLTGYTLRIVREAGDNGSLYGSVTALEISNLLKSAGFPVAKKAICLAGPIKLLGSYAVSLDLHPQVSTEISVEVVRH